MNNIEQIIARQEEEFKKLQMRGYNIPQGEAFAVCSDNTIWTAEDIWNWHSSSIKEILEGVKLKISDDLCNLLNLYSIEDLDNEIARNTDERIKYVAVFGRGTINYLESIIKQLK